MNENDADVDVPVPDANGVVDISHATWVNLDDRFFTERPNSLLIFRASSNRLVQLPPTLGSVRFLRELHVDHNRIGFLPPEIGKCTELRVLNAPHNLLQRLPDEITYCTKLEIVHVENNLLTELPQALNRWQALQTLDISNNKLKSIPESISLCPNVELIQCSGNVDLDIPKQVRENTGLVLWICKTSRQHREEVAELKDINAYLEDMARVSDEEKLRLKDRILALEREVKDLRREWPKYYLAVKNRLKRLFLCIGETTGASTTA